MNVRDLAHKDETFSDTFILLLGSIILFYFNITNILVFYIYHLSIFLTTPTIDSSKVSMVDAGGRKFYQVLVKNVPTYLHLETRYGTPHVPIYSHYTASPNNLISNFVADGF